MSAETLGGGGEPEYSDRQASALFRGPSLGAVTSRGPRPLTFRVSTPNPLQPLAFEGAAIFLSTRGFMSRVRLTSEQSAGLLQAVAIALEDIGHDGIAKHLRAAAEKPRDAFHVADIIREQVLAAEDARREAQGPVRKRKE